MSETHSLKLEINASAAKRGAADFEGAVKRIDTAVKNLDKSADKAFSNIQKNVGKVNFSALARGISSLNAISLNPRLVTGLRNLSTTIGAMKAVSGNTINSIRQLANSLNSLNGAQANVRNLNSLFRALNNIKAPPAAAAQGINLIANAVRNLRAPTNTNAIVAALTSIASAANATYTALHRLGALSVTVRAPRTTGGGAGGTGRAAGGVAPGYGFGPGRSAASGLRGFENVGNLSYQAGSAVRTAVGGLTAGAALQQITAVTREADSFRSTLMSVGVTAEDTAKLQDQLAQSVMRLGMDYMSVSQNLRQFVSGAVATGVSVTDASSMFDNFAVSMRASGLGATQAEGALRAMTQMFGKGRITAEEFRGQMAEHWSAFGPLFARYVYPEIADANARMARLTEDMEKRGFNPRILIGFSQYMRQNMQSVAQTMSQTLDAAINRTKSAWALLMKDMGEGPAGKELANFFERIARILQQPAFRQFMNEIGQGLANVLKTLGDGAEWAARNLDLVKYALTGILALGALNFVIGLTRAFAGLFTPIVAGLRFLGLLSGGTASATSAFTILGNVLRTVFRVLTLHPYGRILAVILSVGAAVVDLAGGFTNLGRTITENLDFIPATLTVIDRRIRELFSGTIFERAVQSGNALRSVIDDIRTVSPTAAAALENAFNNIDLGPGMMILRGLYDAAVAAGGALSRARTNVPENQQNIPDASFPGVPGSRRSHNGPAQGQSSIPQQTPAQRFAADIVAERAARTAARNAERIRQANGERATMDGEIGERGNARTPEQSSPLVAGMTPEQRRGMMGAGRGSNGGANRREGVENFFGRLDPSFRVLEEYQDGLHRINQARQMGIGTAQQHTHWEGLLREQFLQQVGAVDNVAQANRQYERALAAVNGAEQAGFLTAEAATAARRRLNTATEEARDPIGYLIRSGQEEIDILNNRNAVYEDEVALLRIRNQLRQQGIELEGESEQRVRQSIVTQRRANQAYQDSQQGVASWANSFRDVGTELAKLEEKFLNQFADALTEFVNTGKADWRSLADSIVKDIQQLIIKEGIRELLSALGLISGSTQDGFRGNGSIISSIGSMIGSGLGGGNSTKGNIQDVGGPTWLSSIGNLVGSIFGVSGLGTMAENTSGVGSGGMKSDTLMDPSVLQGGGIIGPVAKEGFMPGSRNNIHSMMPAHSFVGAPHFREGTGNTSGGMPAVLHDNEAVIPLSRGRKVPIEGGMGKTTNVFNVSTPDADSFRKNHKQVLKGYSQKMARIQSRGG